MKMDVFVSNLKHNIPLTDVAGFALTLVVSNRCFNLCIFPCTHGSLRDFLAKNEGNRKTNQGYAL